MVVNTSYTEKERLLPPIDLHALVRLPLCEYMVDLLIECFHFSLSPFHTFLYLSYMDLLSYLRHRMSGIIKIISFGEGISTFLTVHRMGVSRKVVVFNLEVKHDLKSSV